MKAACERCGKRRKLKRVHGPGLHWKGVEMCRPCLKALQFAAKHAGEEGNDVVADRV